MVDSVYRTRSLGVAAEGLPDQYADGKAAKVWEFYIGHKQGRTSQYKHWFCEILKEHGVQTILDVACGTGIDSIMMLESGFDVVSTDASDKMLKYALKERWNRRKEEAFDKWVIEEANWLTLEEDLEDLPEKPTEGFDAVLCLGNSFAHLPDFTGNLVNQKQALMNFKALIRPGGLLLIDHRNYDEILKTGSVPAKNVYYNSDYIVDMKCSNLYVNCRPTMVTLDYEMDITALAKQQDSPSKGQWNGTNSTHKFRLSYYPHQLKEFNNLLTDVFGDKIQHKVYGDFKPYGEIEAPAYYIHVVQTPTE